MTLRPQLPGQSDRAETGSAAGGSPAPCPMPDDLCADCGYRCGEASLTAAEYLQPFTPEPWPTVQARAQEALRKVNGAR